MCIAAAKTTGEDKVSRFSLDGLIILTSRPLNPRVNQARNVFWKAGSVYILISLYNYTLSCNKSPGDLVVWIMLSGWVLGRWERIMNYVIHSISNDLMNCASWKVNGLLAVCKCSQQPGMHVWRVAWFSLMALFIQPGQNKHWLLLHCCKKKFLFIKKYKKYAWKCSNKTIDYNIRKKAIT